MKVQLNKKLTKLKIVISGTDAMQIRDDISGMLRVKMPINAVQSLRIAVLSEFFGKHLNSMHFEREVSIILSIAEVIAFWQVFSTSCDPFYQHLTYKMLVEITSKTNITLPKT